MVRRTAAALTRGRTPRVSYLRSLQTYRPPFKHQHDMARDLNRQCGIASGKKKNAARGGDRASLSPTASTPRMPATPPAAVRLLALSALSKRPYATRPCCTVATSSFPTRSCHQFHREDSFSAHAMEKDLVEPPGRVTRRPPTEHRPSRDAKACVTWLHSQQK